MPNQRASGKKLVTFWATEEEKALLQAASKAAGFDSISDYIRWIAANQPSPAPPPTSKKRAAKGKG